jgi:hypothetical protein
MMTFLKGTGVNGIAVAFGVVIILMLKFVYDGVNPKYLNHIVIINERGRDTSNSKVNLSLYNFKGKKELVFDWFLGDLGYGTVIHYNSAWLDGKVVSLNHDGVTERTGIGSAGRYGHTLFVEVHRDSPSLAGWDQIPSIASRGKTMPSGELNGAYRLYTFEQY